MKEEDFEGTLILEELASRGLLSDFYDAIDSDDLQLAIQLMRRADIEEEEIALVLKKIEQENGEAL